MFLRLLLISFFELCLANLLLFIVKQYEKNAKKKKNILLLLVVVANRKIQSFQDVLATPPRFSNVTHMRSLIKQDASSNMQEQIQQESQTHASHEMS